MRYIVDKFHEGSIRFNPKFAAGYAVREVATSARYLENVISCIQIAFPKGLEFEGIEVCSPEKAFNNFIELSKTDKKYTYDFARSDYYLVQLNFRFNGEPLPLYVYLPFTDHNGVMYVRDRPYYVTPVMANPAISVTDDGLFLILIQGKFTTRGRGHFVFKDGVLTRIKILETPVHNTLRSIQQNDNRLSRMRITTNVHYLIARYGYKVAFERFGATVQAGKLDVINYNNYPSSDWVIYSSSVGEMNIQMNSVNTFIPNEIRLAVKKNNEGVIPYDVESMVGAFFYILDFMPEIDSVDDLDDKGWWIIKLGRIILGVDEDSRSVMKKMNNHFTTIDTYIDPTAIQLLASMNIYISDFYDYLEWTIRSFDEYRENNGRNANSMYGKHLIVNRYIFETIIISLFKALYELRQKKTDKLTYKDVSQKLRTNLRPDNIMRNNSKCPNIVSINSSTDSRIIKVGAAIMPQDQMRKTKQKLTPASLQSPSWEFDVSFIDCGNFASMSKSHPIGNDGGNPCINIDANGRIRPQERFKELMKRTQDMLTQS